MKIQYCSDLHLEFSQNKYFLEKNKLIPSGDVLILCGDVLLFSEMNKAKYKDFFDYISSNWMQTYIIPGNHEFYYYNILCDIFRNEYFYTQNIKIVNNVSIIDNNIRFIFSTLWSYIPPDKEWSVKNSLNDFHVIKYGGYILTPFDYNNFHNESLTFIKEELLIPFDGKTIIATHHCPTFIEYNPDYKDNSNNNGFATELSDLILDNNIDYWLFGHTHYNCNEFKIGNTTLLTNQLGYVQYNEHNDFKFDKFIEI